MEQIWAAIRKSLFWLHLCVGVLTGVFIFIMAATGVVLSFERQIIDFADRDIRSVAIPQDAQPRPVNDLLTSVRRSGLGDPTAILARNESRAAAQFSVGRAKTIYVDPYSGAVLGVSSERAHEFFFAVERLHRALGAQLGPKNAGRQIVAVSNLLFAVLILFGAVLWLPRKFSWKWLRAAIAFRSGLGGKARDWNWHNVVGIWCAVPLLVIALTGIVMSFDWANALLFRLTGSTQVAGGPDRGGRPRGGRVEAAPDPNYDQLLSAAKTLNPDWHTITLNVPRDATSPLAVSVDTGAGGQPQKRDQYLLNRNTGAVVKVSTFADNSLGQRLRAFVRFGHTGEYLNWPGQLIAAFASLGACVLVYTGLSLSIRRLTARLKRTRLSPQPDAEHAERSVLVH